MTKGTGAGEFCPSPARPPTPTPLPVSTPIVNKILENAIYRGGNYGFRLPQKLSAHLGSSNSSQ